MTANELRVGNWIQWKSNGEKEQVMHIETRGVKNAIINGVNIADVEPIPLAEEWLLRFGFKDVTGKPNRFIKDPDKAFFKKERYKDAFWCNVKDSEMHSLDFVVSFSKNTKDDIRIEIWVQFLPFNDQTVLKEEGVSQIDPAPIKYVHQLQNLYCSLTQKELEWLTTTGQVTENE